MKKGKQFKLEEHRLAHLEPLIPKAPYVLRITEWKDYPVPVLVLKERREYQEEKKKPAKQQSLAERSIRRVLAEIATMHGGSLGRCLPLLRDMVKNVRDDADVPLELQRYMTKAGLRMRCNLPLDEEAGAKLGLLFRLQVRVKELDRVELMARRIMTFSREEAAYWLSRTTSFGTDANRWALAGLRLMLGGQPHDAGVDRMLIRLRDGVS